VLDPLEIDAAALKKENFELTVMAKRDCPQINALFSRTAVNCGKLRNSRFTWLPWLQERFKIESRIKLFPVSLEPINPMKETSNVEYF
jgi:hypothetical protein